MDDIPLCGGTGKDWTPNLTCPVCKQTAKALRLTINHGKTKYVRKGRKIARHAYEERTSAFPMVR